MRFSNMMARQMAQAKQATKAAEGGPLTRLTAQTRDGGLLVDHVDGTSEAYDRAGNPVGRVAAFGHVAERLEAERNALGARIEEIDTKLAAWKAALKARKAQAKTARD